jgi:hypothetical protein
MRIRILIVAASLVLAGAVRPQSADPIVHLKFDDEKSAVAAADSSGKNHAAKLMGGATLGEGKLGGALKLDGKGGHAEISAAPDLDRLNEGSYSLAAWFKPDDLPPGKESNNNAAYGIVMRTGWHEGLEYTNEGKFTMVHWLEGDPAVWHGTSTWEETFDPGKWHHVVGVVDATARTVKIYVNGELKTQSDPWEAGKSARRYETTWKVGIGAPGAEKWAYPAKGAIDDVRIYNRALKDDEVKKLHEAGAAGK